MDLLEEYHRQFIITKSRVLQEVDEFTLFAFYLGYVPELRTTYRSPIREKDDSPSFSIFENTRSKKEVDYLWKDSALNKSGTIFELLELMFNISSEEVLQLINNDFAILDDSKEVKVTKIVPKPVTKHTTRIRIKSKLFSSEGLGFWSKYGIDLELLNWKQVKEVEYIWYSDEQEVPHSCNKELTFAYPEYNRKYKTWHYQIYIPLTKDKQFKFRNDLSHNMLYGNNHLEYKTELLVITKSNKDILVLKKFGYESIAARSETTPIKLKHIEYYKTRYKRLVILYDNDEAGVQAASIYDLPSVIIPIESGCKDISDFLEKYGEEESRKLLNKLLNEN